MRRLDHRSAASSSARARSGSFRIWESRRAARRGRDPASPAGPQELKADAGLPFLAYGLSRTRLDASLLDLAARRGSRGAAGSRGALACPDRLRRLAGPAQRRRAASSPGPSSWRAANTSCAGTNGCGSPDRAASGSRCTGGWCPNRRRRWAVPSSSSCTPTATLACSRSMPAGQSLLRDGRRRRSRPWARPSQRRWLACVS